ncbi:hypothetical protein Sjap_008282 [Stephania japonica]|uniref:Uncharacterized protein n=1 Tax=Stephania japonica TaxID=461633 RepID=A0AAP0JQS4_9MAGN
MADFVHQQVDHDRESTSYQTPSPQTEGTWGARMEGYEGTPTKTRKRKGPSIFARPE